MDCYDVIAPFFCCAAVHEFLALAKRLRQNQSRRGSGPNHSNANKPHNSFYVNNIKSTDRRTLKQDLRNTAACKSLVILLCCESVAFQIYSSLCRSQHQPAELPLCTQVCCRLLGASNTHTHTHTH